MVTVSMNPAQHPTMFDHDGSGNIARESRNVVQMASEKALPLFPFVRRESTHKEMLDESNEEDSGCIYSRGMALYSADSICCDYRETVLQHSAQPDEGIDTGTGKLFKKADPDAVTNSDKPVEVTIRVASLPVGSQEPRGTSSDRPGALPASNALRSLALGSDEALEGELRGFSSHLARSRAYSGDSERRSSGSQGVAAAEPVTNGPGGSKNDTLPRSEAW